jgi:hypothetical protein
VPLDRREDRDRQTPLLEMAVEPLDEAVISLGQQGIDENVTRAA